MKKGWRAKKDAVKSTKHMDINMLLLEQEEEY